LGSVDRDKELLDITKIKELTLKKKKYEWNRING
jgi:hypothetical protein